MSVDDQRRAVAARDAMAREEQVRTAERDFWDRSVEYIRDGIGPWRPDRETYQEAVQSNRVAAEQYVDRKREYADRERGRGEDGRGRRVERDRGVER